MKNQKGLFVLYVTYSDQMHLIFLQKL